MKEKFAKLIDVKSIVTLVLTGAFMLFTRGNEWIVSLTIAAILELYTSVRIPQEEAKEGLS